MLRMAVPGNPGEDYPIYAEVPETSFTCEGRVEGGYYADTEAECQPFHVCSADRDGGLARGTLCASIGSMWTALRQSPFTDLMTILEWSRGMDWMMQRLLLQGNMLHHHLRLHLLLQGDMLHHQLGLHHLQLEDMPHHLQMVLLLGTHH